MKHKHTKLMIKYDSVLHNITSSNLIYKPKIQKRQQNKEVISRKTKRLKLKTVQRKEVELY